MCLGEFDQVSCILVIIIVFDLILVLETGAESLCRAQEDYHSKQKTDA